MSYSCWRCKTGSQAEPGYCSTCSLDIQREQVWAEAGFPGTFDPEFDTRFAEEPKPEKPKPVESEFCIIELEPGCYHLAESASVTGYLLTSEPLRATRVNQTWAMKETLPKLQKTHVGAKLVIVKAAYILVDVPTT